MELSVVERLLILNLDTLPKVGNIITMKIKQKMMNDVGFTEQEIKDFDLKQSGDAISWNNTVSPVQIDLGPEAVKMLIDAIEKSESLHDGYIPLYDKLKESV